MSFEAILLLCLAAFVAGPVAYLLTPGVIRLAERAGAMAQPGGRHSHRKPTPQWGGLAIVGGFFAGGVLVLVLGRLLGAITDLTASQMAGIGVGGLLVAVLGAADDRYDVRPLPKFLGQVLCASVLLATGVRIEGFLNHPLSPWFGGILTVFWVVAIVNAINFIDGLDGLAAGVTAIATITFAIISATRGQVGAAVLCVALAAGCVGFLPHNFSPARIFMGDTGSHFLGYVVASVAVAGTLKRAAAVTIAAATLALAFPLLDTAFAVLRRFLRGQAISVADNEHLHHRLVHGGLSDVQAVLVIWAICAVCSVAAVFISQRGGG